jgi:predicted DNA-binding transcriptional regulator AlpA
MSTPSRGIRHAPAPAPPQHFGLLLPAKKAALYLGVSVSTFYVLRASVGFPEQVPVPNRTGGAKPYYSREELRVWVRSLRAAKRGEEAA